MCREVLTVGLLAWKSSSAKKCVTTYLPNFSATKMNVAQDFYRNFGEEVCIFLLVGGRDVWDEAGG